LVLVIIVCRGLVCGWGVSRRGIEWFAGEKGHNALPEGLDQKARPDQAGNQQLQQKTARSRVEVSMALEKGSMAYPVDKVQ
jgi:hypothetical protein